jgi:peptidoglycan hydrolase-like protein with peptidoglycan-binding domain
MTDETPYDRDRLPRPFFGAGTLTPLALATAAVPNAGTGASPSSSVAQMSSPTQERHAAYSHRVALWQEALDSVGANVRIDGVLGPATEAALKHYQQQNGLPTTGQLDAATQPTLDPIG